MLHLNELFFCLSLLLWHFFSMCCISFWLEENVNLQTSHLGFFPGCVWLTLMWLLRLNCVKNVSLQFWHLKFFGFKWTSLKCLLSNALFLMIFSQMLHFKLSSFFLAWQFFSVCCRSFWKDENLWRQIPQIGFPLFFPFFWTSSFRRSSSLEVSSYVVLVRWASFSLGFSFVCGFLEIKTIDVDLCNKSDKAIKKFYNQVFPLENQSKLKISSAIYRLWVYPS